MNKFYKLTKQNEYFICNLQTPPLQYKHSSSEKKMINDKTIENHIEILQKEFEEQK